MHTYSTDSTERNTMPAGLLGMAALSAFVLSRILASLNFQPWWIEIPSVVGFYGFWHAAFDRKLWRLPILRKVGLVTVPDLQGEWTVTGKSSHEGRTFAGTVSIQQTWRS